MWTIRKAALLSYRHDGLSFDELNKVAKYFDNLTEEALKKEGEHIELYLCRYSSESVAHYRIAMTLYEFTCKRHKLLKIDENLND